MSFGFWQIALIAGLVFLAFRSQSIHKFLKEFGKGVKAFKDEVSDDAHKGNIVSLASARKDSPVKKTPLKTPIKKLSATKSVVKKTAQKKAPAKPSLAKSAGANAKKPAAKKPIKKK
ncbi:MAG: twin-arginine translocase TatA/TatE family subunit [Alphaproteobacteria bacterium]|nr:MAG: twin-arginine translocase TatA/TatE family subunit [Alphaproteobacteria bacterium]